MEHPLARDLDHVLAHTPSIWDAVRGRRVFITGGTGFVGTWLVESFVWANERLNLNARLIVLTRDPEAFCEKAPHAARHPSVEFLHGETASSMRSGWLHQDGYGLIWTIMEPPRLRNPESLD